MTNSLDIDDFMHFPLARSEARNIFLSPPAASAMTHTGACHWQLSFDSLIFMLSITKTNPVQLQQWVWTDVHTRERVLLCFAGWNSKNTSHLSGFPAHSWPTFPDFIKARSVFNKGSYYSTDTQLPFKKGWVISFSADYLFVDKRSTFLPCWPF